MQTQTGATKLKHTAASLRATPLGGLTDSVQRLTFLVRKFILMSSFMFSVTGLYSAIQLFFRGVILCCGTVTCISKVSDTAV